MPQECVHLRKVTGDVTPSADGCEEYLAIGATQFHLRICLTCGHVGCCNSSSNKHATKHFHAVGHPVMQSFEPGETWKWCYVDQLFMP